MSKQMIKSVVDQFDPIGLLEMNCPPEEYDAEVERIFARIRKGMSVKDISDVIHAVFLEMFDECIDTKVCDAMAYKILSLDAAPADIRGKGHLTPG